MERLAFKAHQDFVAARRSVGATRPSTDRIWYISSGKERKSLPQSWYTHYVLVDIYRVIHQSYDVARFARANAKWSACTSQRIPNFAEVSAGVCRGTSTLGCDQSRVVREDHNRLNHCTLRNVVRKDVRFEHRLLSSSQAVLLAPQTFMPW